MVRHLCWPRRALTCCLALVAAASASPAACPGNTTAAEVLAGLDLSSKTAVVTGGDSGLGYEVARALAYRGASVVIANRNETSGQRAAKQIAQETGARIEAMHLDLGSLASVRAFASECRQKLPSGLDLLINNGGIGGPSKMTADGFELVFEVDYLGHFLLTELMLPSLRAAAASRGGARMVNVASGAHENACESAGWPADCFKDWTYLPPPMVPVKNVTVHTKSGVVTQRSSSYGIAKFLNIQHAAAVARREERAGVQAFSLTPGFALTSMTQHYDPSDPKMQSICAQQVAPDPSLPRNPCPFSAEQGAAVIAYLATGQGLTSGAYFSRTWACEQRPVVMQGFSEESVLELYKRSLQWAGIGESLVVL